MSSQSINSPLDSGSIDDIFIPRSRYKGKCVHPAKGIDCRQFDPYACEDEKINPLYDGPWQAVRGSKDPNTDIEGVCAGDWVSGEIVDQLGLPSDLPAGDYVLGFRWDCE